MNSTTPTKMNSGDSQDRSNENTTAIRLVPTSAPSITASAVGSATRPWPTKEETISAVAVLDCTSAVTPMPRERGREAVADAARQDVAQVGAEDAQDAGANEVGAPDQQRHGRQQIQQMLHA